MLLIKALFDKAGTYKALEACLKKRDEIEDTLQEELRVVSKVEIHHDQENLNKLILHDNPDLRSKHYKNFKYLLNQIDEWRRTKNAGNFN